MSKKTFTIAFLSSCFKTSKCLIKFGYGVYNEVIKNGDTSCNCFLINEFPNANLQLVTKKQYFVFIAHPSCSDVRATISYCSIRNAYRTDAMRWPYNIQDRFPTFSTKIEMQGSRNNITRHTDRLGSWIVLICLYFFYRKRKFYWKIVGYKCSALCL